MPGKEIIHIQQGVWIDEQWLKKAGLGMHVQIKFLPGEIRIQSAPALPGEKKPRNRLAVQR